MQRNVFFNRKSFLVILTLLVFFCGMQTMEPASAAKWKLISTGGMGDFGDYQDISWYVYKKSKNYLKVCSSFDLADTYDVDDGFEDGGTYKITMILKKVSKNKLKITDTISNGYNSITKVNYIKTKDSAYLFYCKQQLKALLKERGFFSWYIQKVQKDVRF